MDMSHRQELSTRSGRQFVHRYTRRAGAESLCCLTIIREPTQCSRLAEHNLHPGVVASRFASKQRPRAAREEAERAGRW